MTTEQRLERLEREIRWMRRIGAVAVAVAAAVFLIGQGKDKKLPDLDVRSLTIVDKNGAGRVRLSEKGLSLHDKAGNPRAILSANPNGPVSLFLTDYVSGPGGVTRIKGTAELTVEPNGATSLRLSDRNDKMRAGLFTDADGTPSLHLADKHGTQRTSLKTTADGAILGFYDDDGKMRIMLGAKGDRHSLKFIDTAGESRATFGATAGFPALKLAEGSGTTRILLSASPGFRGLYLRDKDDMPRAVLEMVDGSPTFKFGDAKGNVIWQAPR